jgi:uncharacterized protein Yka (UPF0111/DUF47 family)
VNDKRRKPLEEIKEQILALVDEVQAVSHEEEEAYYGMPEGLKNTPNREKMQEAITAMETVIESLEEVQDALNEAIA